MELTRISLIIPTHNRPKYLQRILKYYSLFDLQIIVVDSSAAIYEGSINSNVEYHYLPGIPLPQKLAYALKAAKTEFMVFCADDDFIIPDAIRICIQFLDQHKDYASVQGNSITYKKRSRYTGFIEFNLLYNDIDIDLNQENPLDRLTNLFRSYRTIFSAVHYTKNMLLAYDKLDSGIVNLFLNEYITAILPVVVGKHKELPLFYQVREYSEISGDKTTDNLDVIYQKLSYRKELDSFLDYEASKISNLTGIDFFECKTSLNDILKKYANELIKRKQLPISSIKILGNILKSIPIIGERIVIKRRLKEQKRKLQIIIRSDQDVDQLELIKSFIFKYGDVVA